MIPIKDILNKIRWDPKEKAEYYLIAYLDRVKGDLIEVPYPEIKGIEDNFFVIEEAGKEVSIPLHRIKVVKRNDIIIWRRKF